MSMISSSSPFNDAAKAREKIVKNIQSNLRHVASSGYNYALIDDTLSNYVDYLEVFDGIIIQYSKWTSTLQFIKNIRTHDSPKLMLKPIYLYHNEPINLLPDRWTIDGLISDLGLLDDTDHRTKRILQRLDINLSDTIKSYDFNLNKTILFHHTRQNEEIEPFMSRYSKLGYQFPFLSYFYDFTDKATSLHALKDGQHKQWLIAEFLDTVYVCNHCEDGFLIYREVCPHCFSSDLAEQEIIHHFRCAHVAPISKFIQNENNLGELSCPKCYKELQHVGVDYDRPAVIQHCNKCHKDFQNVSIMTRCSSCSQEIPVEHLFKKKINKYRITPKGVTESLIELQQGDSQKENRFPEGKHEGLLTRKGMHDLLISVNEDSRYNSFLAIIRIKKPSSKLKQIGTGKYTSLTLEVIQNIKSIIGEQVEVTFKNLVIYLFIPNSDKKLIDQQLEKADLLATTLLHDNLGASGDNLISYKALSVHDYITEWKDVLDLMDEA